MQYNDQTQGQGLLQQEEFDLFGDNAAGRITGTQSMLNNFARLNNNALDRLETKIMQVDQKWKFDDASITTDFPIAVKDIVLGQQDYGLSNQFLKVIKVRIKDISGNWTNWLNVQDPRFFLKPTSNGSPTTYGETDNSIVFDVPFNYNSTGGIEVTFQRAMVRFQPGDTTLVPGIPSLFHPLIGKYAVMEYASTPGRNITLTPVFYQQVQDMEKDMEDFFSTRNDDQISRINITGGWYGDNNRQYA